MTNRLYLGITSDDWRELFRCPDTPTSESHGHKYRAVIGPFRTIRAADYMARHGKGSNPHLQTVSDAERIAKLEKHRPPKWKIPVIEGVRHG